MEKPYSILFVCTGNICRSPTAEAVFRHRIREMGFHGQFAHDSAGTHDYHVGEAPDARSISALRKAGIDMGDLRARTVRQKDFYEYDLILAMDRGHLSHLKRVAPEGATAELALYLDHTLGTPGDVPDPYYGELSDFLHVIDLVNDATTALLARLNGQKGLKDR